MVIGGWTRLSEQHDGALLQEEENNMDREGKIIHNLLMI